MLEKDICLTKTEQKVWLHPEFGPHAQYFYFDFQRLPSGNYKKKCDHLLMDSQCKVNLSKLPKLNNFSN